ncbi:MAG TPA: tetratricopeptide repeat protein [Rhizomicrobium sp.]|nr:tetratricopeptide repeat protein [Rhizomicrobium sp.]
MADIFREVEEEVRRERYERLWKKYRDHITAAGALIIIGVAGYQLYRVYEQREEQKASVAYAAATEMLDRGQSAAAAPQLAALAKTAPGGYAAVAKLAEADALFSEGQKADAIRIYQQIANGGDPYLGAAARLHAAWAIADSAPRSDVDAMLAPLLDKSSAWHQLAREIIAYEDLRSGNTAAALQAYRDIAADPDAPGGLKSRAEAMARFINAGGDANYGTVPEAKPAAAPAVSKQHGGAPVR